MELAWLPLEWEDYLHWQQTDKKVLKRTNPLIKDIMRSPFDGIGKPEPLKENYSGWWSRSITGEHRLMYKSEVSRIIIMKCRYHY